jgi:PTH2 family peptidyl-tRNA hydrolase
MSTSDYTQASILISTGLVSVFSGFLLGVYAIRGYLISPELHAERQANTVDPVESDEEDIDQDDTILDHAPNWANGEAADRRDGLRAKAAATPDKARERKPEAAVADTREACKLVLVVRTDLGMTKGA